jgi:hypothetical protein
MRRQLSQHESEQIASSLSVDPNENGVGALQEALTKISEIYPVFTIRDFTSVWNLRHPDFKMDKNLQKSFGSMLRLEGNRKGFWVLSSSTGDILPAKKEEVSSPKENLTLPWMQKAIKEGMHLKISANIKTKFPQETFEDITSEVCQLMLIWGKEARCDAYLKAGKPPTVAILSVWAEQKIRQRTYKDAMDALNREFKGLRTQTEIRKRREKNLEDLILEQGTKIDPNLPKTIWVIQEDETAEAVIVAPEPEEEESPQEEKFQMIRNFIRVRRKKSSDRFVRIYDHIKSGTPRKEVALLEGCSELTVSQLTQKVREDLREAPKLLQIAIRLLKKISEEPYSTFEEIQEENTSLESEKIEEALQVLMLGNLISETRGRSFFPTEAGISFGEQL